MSRPPAYQLVRADCGRGIPLADGSIHAVVTSPPYFALRSYEGVSPTEWPELAYAPLPGLPPLVVPAMTCCLGAEPDPAAFAGHLVRVFDDVKRVLHKSGCAWVNLGDSYATNPGNGRGGEGGANLWGGVPHRSGRDKTGCGLPVKNMLMIPARFALAMQARGWYLRSAPPWIKPGNAMPESVADRPTTAHESLFMFTKSADYYFDMESVKRNMAPGSVERYAYGFGGAKSEALVEANKNGMGNRTRPAGNREPPAGRNLRTADVFLESLDELIAWHLDRIDLLTRARQSGGLVADDDDDPAAVLVNPEAFRGSHYAVMPRRLAEILVKCSTSEAGVCGQCGAPYERVTEIAGYERQRWKPGEDQHHTRAKGKHGASSVFNTGFSAVKSTLGWRPTCPCPPGPTRPAVVLDPFAGSGTTLVVAQALGRDALGLDASADYLRMAARRLDRPHARPLALAEPADDAPGPLFPGGEP